MEDETTQAPESKFDMETVMGNFMDMPQEQRQIATRVLTSPIRNVMDMVLGEPVFERLAQQLEQPIPGRREGEPVAMQDQAPAPQEQPSGMMSPEDTNMV
mgnify:CR=1 FL=1